MREIKFRAWADGKMHYAENGDYWYIGDSGYWSLNNMYDDILCDGLESDNPALMQFTGLRDKNGVEIYEGDVVSGSYGLPPRKVEAAVEYDGSAFVLKTPAHTPQEVTLYKAIDYLGEIEVIGHIHGKYLQNGDE